MTERPADGPDTRERDLFLSALEIDATAERARFLDSACGADSALRKRIEELLHEHQEVGTFLQEPALNDPRAQAEFRGEVGPNGTALVNQVAEKSGDRIGRYKLLQQIGEGGCGVVYMAEQEEPVRRRVALKIIKLGMDTKSVIARFEAERQALALMDHPNIARVFDAGATEAGRPYFVMELVRGIKITEYCDQNNLPARKRLELFMQVCQAIQHAHQKGIIHRDIKPSNILVTLHDGVPIPKVIDFGIAKATEQRLTEKTLFTEFTAFIGTPAYMSPEQAEMSGLDIDTRSDIYSLGVLLYELLTGKTPFDPEALFKGGLDECRRTIREQEPLRPSTRVATLAGAELTTTAQQRCTEAPKLVHLLRGDLDWVVMKCLEKDRTRRYATANGLAQEIERYLNDEPVSARPPSTTYRLQKLLRRHRGAVSATAAVAVTLLVGAGVSTWQAIRATHAEKQAQGAQQLEAQLRHQADLQRERAEAQGRRARINEYVADISLAQQGLISGNYGKALQLLNKHLPKTGETDLRGFEWRYLWQLCQGDEDSALPRQNQPVQTIACSPDDRWVAVGTRDQVSIFDRRTKALVSHLPEGASSLAFLTDGKSLVTASPFWVHIWSTENWSKQMELPKSSGPLALSRDGRWLATEGERMFGGRGRNAGGIHVWDTSSWESRTMLPASFAPMAFSPDGETLVAQTRSGLALLRLDGSAGPKTLTDSTNLFRGGPWFASEHLVTFSPDGKYIIAPRNMASEKGVFVLSIWDGHTGEEVGLMPSEREHVEHTGQISSLAFSPDGKTLATASWDHSILLWNFEKRQRIAMLHGHLNEVWAMAFAGDGETLVTGSKDGGIKLWTSKPAPKENLLLAGNWEPVGFTPDSSKLAVLGRAGNLATLDLFTGELDSTVTLEFPSRERFGPRPPGTGGGPGFGPGDGPGGGPREGRGGGPRGGPVGPGMGAFSVAVSADLSTVAQGLEGSVKFWHLKTGETSTLTVGEGRVDLVALSPDASVLVTASHGQALHWWDLRKGASGALGSGAFRAWFSPDGQTLAIHPRDSGLELWDMVSHKLRVALGTNASTMSVAFSPDSRILATTAGPEDLENSVRLWDMQTGAVLGVCTGHKQPVWSVAFSADGKTLATASDDSTLKLWNVATQQELVSILRPGGGLRGLRFSPDGRMLVGASGMFSEKPGIHVFRAPSVTDIESGRSPNVASARP